MVCFRLLYKWNYKVRDKWDDTVCRPVDEFLCLYWKCFTGVSKYCCFSITFAFDAVKRVPAL